MDFEVPEYNGQRGIYMQAEKLMDLTAEIDGLIKKHYEEVAFYKDIDLAPDWDFYRVMEENGHYAFFTLRDSGKLIGYLGAFVRRAPHYFNSVQASGDILYIDPQYRKSGLAVKFVDFCDRRLKKFGVQVSLHHFKHHADFGEVLGKKLGYEKIDHIWGRRLDLMED